MTAAPGLAAVGAEPSAIDAPATPSPGTVTVAVVGICGAEHLGRCLRALDAQHGAPPFDVVVAVDARLAGMDEAAAGFSGRLTLVRTPGRENPVQLAGDALRAARGEVVLLTEDHCVPPPHWVRALWEGIRAAPGAAVIGGGIDTEPDAGALDWAFWFVDFFRYASPVRGGRAPSISVCNAAYRRTQLEALAPLWADGFHETAMHDAQRMRFGALHLEPGATIRMRRRVAFGAALRERYAFGRLFGCTRLAHARAGHRMFYLLLTPTLPALLMLRMAARALPEPSLRGRFVRAMPVLAALVLAWSWGEWLGYLTRRLPHALTTAPEIASR